MKDERLSLSKHTNVENVVYFQSCNNSRELQNIVGSAATLVGRSFRVP